MHVHTSIHTYIIRKCVCVFFIICRCVQSVGTTVCEHFTQFSICKRSLKWSIKRNNVICRRTSSSSVHSRRKMWRIIKMFPLGILLCTLTSHINTNTRACTYPHTYLYKRAMLLEHCRIETCLIRIRGPQYVAKFINKHRTLIPTPRQTRRPLDLCVWLPPFSLSRTCI